MIDAALTPDGELQIGDLRIGLTSCTSDEVISQGGESAPGYQGGAYSRLRLIKAELVLLFLFYQNKLERLTIFARNESEARDRLKDVYTSLRKAEPVGGVNLEYAIDPKNSDVSIVIDVRSQG